MNKEYPNAACRQSQHQRDACRFKRKEQNREEEGEPAQQSVIETADLRILKRLSAEISLNIVAIQRDVDHH